MDQRPGELVPTPPETRSVQPLETRAVRVPARAQVDDSSPEALRAQIEDTRTEMAVTLDAIQEKLDPQRLKERARDELLNVAITQIEPRLEEAEQRAIEAVASLGERAARTVGEKASSLAGATSARTRDAVARVRVRAEKMIYTASVKVQGDGVAGDGPERLASPSALLRTWAQPVVRGVRAYPVTTCLLAAGIALAIGQAVLRTRRLPTGEAGADEARAAGYGGYDGAGAADAALIAVEPAV